MPSRTGETGAEMELRLLQLLRDHEWLCRAASRENGAYCHHLVEWRTPCGSGVDGATLYLVDDAWCLSRAPAVGAPRYATVADYLQTWWKPLNATRQALRHIDSYAAAAAWDTAETLRPLAAGRTVDAIEVAS